MCIMLARRSIRAYNLFWSSVIIGRGVRVPFFPARREKESGVELTVWTPWAMLSGAAGQLGTRTNDILQYTLAFSAWHSI